MTPLITHLDEKWRLPIPTADRPIFPNGVIHCSLRTHSILVGPISYDEFGSYSDTMDKTGRIRIGKNLVRILGVREGDPKEKQVLWIPNKIKDKTEFLLFFGAIGQGTWEQMLATKTAINQLVLT